MPLEQTFVSEDNEQVVDFEVFKHYLAIIIEKNQ